VSPKFIFQIEPVVYSFLVLL